MNTNFPSDYLEKIAKEFADAEQARRGGIQGRMRVCARRGAGFAVAWLCTSRGQQVRDTDSLNLLKMIQSDESFPTEIREASKRLTAKINPDFTYAFPTDPLDDAHIIVNYVKKVLG